MDFVYQVTNMASTEVLKEPRGFIKFLQIGLAIFAFATTSAFHGSTSYTVQCPGEQDARLYSISFSYPFKLDSQTVPVNTCQNTTETSTAFPTKPVFGDFTSSSEFYVFVGVTAFLYSLGILIFYVFGDEKYRSSEIIPIVDFVVTAVYVVLWLISSSAWADAVGKIQHYTDPKDYFVDNYICECKEENPCVDAACVIKDSGNYSTAIVSVIFGFLCMGVWAGNLWFLYKETKWAKSSSQDPMQQSQASSPGSPSQRI